MRSFFRTLLVFSMCQLIVFAIKAQTVTSRGKVTEEDGTPVSGASILIKGTRKATVTAADGQFSITVAGKNPVLVVSAVGFAPQEITPSDNQPLDIKLSKNVSALNEVVVTALGIKREKRQLTYSTQELKGDQLTSTKEPSVLNALAGRVSGVQITSSSGQPGSSSRIVIRGATSITGNNEALIVLDGIPINNSQTGNAGPGNGISRLSDIDPEIIESMNVLKGSAASALYGSDAARGVIIITTKNGGQNRKPQITFNTQYSRETPILTDVQSKYAQGTNGIFSDGNTQKTSELWGPLIDTLKVNGQPVYNKNPLKEFFQTGTTFTNSVSVGGGSGKSSYFFSYSNLTQKGTVPTSEYGRHVAFAKYTTAISPVFTTNFQFNYTSTNSNRVPEGNDIISPLWTVYTAPFTWNPRPIYDSNGIQRVYRLSRNNPYWSLENSYNRSKNNRFVPTFSVTATPLSWLTITERLGADIYAEQTKYYESPSTILASTGRIEDRSNNFRQFNHDLIIEARKKIGSDFDMSFLVGNNAFSTTSQNYSISGSGITLLYFDNISNAATVTSSQNNTMRRKIGFYAQSNLEYKRFLNLSLTGRYDGTSVLAAGKNFYPYGSASAGFIFSELIKTEAITFGKIRASYSSVGNDNIGAYNLQTTYSRAGSFPYNGRSGFLQSNTLSNPDLKNERTNEFEVGLEMRFLKNRIGFEASYFSREGIDLLSSSVGLSAATGYTATVLNANSMTNKGFELIFNATPVKTQSFSWDMTVNFTKINNKVTKIYGNTPFQSLGQTFAFVGQPYGVIYTIGLRKDSLGRQLVDNNGLPLPTTSNVVVGNIQPDWTGGIINTLKYKNVSMSFFFDMKKGGDIVNFDDVYGYFYGSAKVTENREDRVVPGIRLSDGKVNETVVTARNYYQRLNTMTGTGVQDGTYIKLRNVNLSYDLPRKLFTKGVFNSATLTATGRNLFIYTPHFTGPDPETSTFGSGNGDQGFYNYSVPTSRSFNLTLNVTFK